MNRPIGFDLADLTADDRRALRNSELATMHHRQTAALFTGLERGHQAAKRRRQQQTRAALISAAKVAGGVLGCIGFVAYLAVFLGV